MHSLCMQLCALNIFMLLPVVHLQKLSQFMSLNNVTTLLFTTLRYDHGKPVTYSKGTLFVKNLTLYHFSYWAARNIPHSTYRTWKLCFSYIKLFTQKSFVDSAHNSSVSQFYESCCMSGSEYYICNNNNSINNNNASISIAQNKLSSIVLMAVQTNMSLVFPQKSAQKRMQSKC